MQEPATGLEPPHKRQRGGSSLGALDPLAKPSASQDHDKGPEAPLNAIPGLGGDPEHCQLCRKGGKKGGGMIACAKCDNRFHLSCFTHPPEDVAPLPGVEDVAEEKEEESEVGFGLGMNGFVFGIRIQKRI